MKQGFLFFRRLITRSAAAFSTTLGAAVGTALLLSVAPQHAAAQALPWQWANTLCIGNAAATTTDAAGNVYVTGRFSGTAVFDTTTLISAGADDIFVAKLTSSGTYAWVVQAGGAQGDTGLGIAIDDATGDVYVAGSFDSPFISFGPTMMPNSGGGGFGNSDGFLAKLSEAGVWQWAKAIGGGGIDVANSVTVNSQGLIYVTGQFTLTIGLGPSRLLSAGGSDVFIGQFDAVGRCQWGASAGGLAADSGTDISFDAAGDAYVAGTYISPTIQFGNTTITSNSPFDNELFVAKLSQFGVWQWVAVAGGSDNESVGWLDVDRFGNVYVSGGFRSLQAYFGPITLTNTSTQNFDIFVAKLNPAGVWQWAARAGSPLNDFASTIALDASDSPVVAGMFAGGTATFGTHTISNSTTAGAEVFVARLSPTGVWSWAASAGGAGADFGTDVAVDLNDNVYVVGRYGGQAATFGATQLTSTAANFQSTAFVARLGSNRLALADEAAANQATVWPNPARETVRVLGPPNTKTALLLDALGREISRTTRQSADGAFTFNLRSLPAGLYLIQTGAQTHRLLVAE